MLDSLKQDVRIALRSLRRSAAYFGLVAGILGISLGAGAVLFGLVDALLLRELPVRGAERLVRIVTVRPPVGARSSFGFREEYLLWQKELVGFETLFAWSEQDLGFALGEAKAAQVERARVHFVSENFYEALEAKASVGRLTGRGDAEPGVGGAMPVVLSDAFWRKRFGADPQVLGKTISLQGMKALIVGVSARDFNGLSVETSPDLRAPMGWWPLMRDGEIFCEVAGKIKEGVAAEGLRQQAEALWRNGKGSSVRSVAFAFEAAGRGVSRMRNDYGVALWLVAAGMAALILAVCVNVAGLAMARAAGKRQEVAIRKALGASTGRLLLDSLWEPALILVAALGLGLAIAKQGLPLLVSVLPPVRDLTTQRLELALRLEMDWRVAGFLAGAAAVAFLVMGIWPVLGLLRSDARAFLVGGDRVIRQWHGRRAVVVVQVALCTALLCGAGLSLGTLQKLESLERGFSAADVTTFSVSPRLAGYDAEGGEKLRERLLAELRAAPGMESVGLAGRGPLRGSGIKMTMAWAGEKAASEDFLNVSGQGISAGYLESLGMRVLAGRGYEGLERSRDVGEKGPKAVLVSQEFARKFGAGREVLGRRFDFVAVNGKPAEAGYEIVGVVSDAKYRSLREPFQPVVYGRLEGEQDFVVHAKSRLDLATTVEAVRAALRRADPRLSFGEVTTLEADVAASLWAERSAAWLSAAFAVLAALVSAAGLIALMSFTAVQRRREFGIRAAVGARPADVFALLFGDGMGLSISGLFLGLLAAWLAAPAVESMLYGVTAREGLVYAGTAALVVLLSGLSLAGPALRAAKADPGEALRRE
jgi:predicted permease